MPFYLSKLNPVKLVKLLLYIWFAANVCSCKPVTNVTNSQNTRLMHTADSLIIAGDLVKGRNLIWGLRHLIKNTDPEIVDYYCYRSELNEDHHDISSLYADSALAYFANQNSLSKYKALYQRALITRGDAFVRSKKYISALDYYYQADEALPDGQCNNGDIDEKVGSIYFAQKNYKNAALYWSKSYNQISLCNSTYSVQKKFFITLSRLNNAGFAFQKAGILDSASYYYLTGLKLINATSNVISTHSLDASRIMIFDNLGGLNLKKGNIEVAEDYLNKAINITITHTDGMLIPPFIKLGELYVKKGQIEKAAQAFIKSRLLLDKYAVSNRESELQWYLSYAEYLFKANRPIDAYLTRNHYIALKDSLDRSDNELYRLDVSREFYNVNQRQTLLELEQQDKLKMLYLVGIGIALCLFFIVMYLINRNLLRAKRNHTETNLRNRQLQLTLAELERVNKNYIRVMRVMAHDIINPLSGMTGIASMLMISDEVSEDDKHMLKLIESTGLNSMEMINELLKAGLTNDDDQLQTEVVNLRSLLFDSVELLQFKANDKNQQIVFEFAETPVMAAINHEKIWRVFNNLIVNAIKFSYDGGQIQVGIKSNNDKILIWVADNGIGVPDKDKETIFEMFTSAKKTGTNGEQPFGLGLSISKKIIELHGGKIWFENQQHQGTIFYIELPAII
jgi:signal transduction histidine kinase